MPSPLPAARGHAAPLGQAFWGAVCRQLPAQLSTSPPAARSTLLCLGGAGSPEGFLGTGAPWVPLPEEKRSRQPGAVGRRLCRAERGRAGGEGQTTAPSRLLSSAPRAARARQDAQRHAAHRHGEMGTAPRDGQGLDAWPWGWRGACGSSAALKLPKKMWGAALPCFRLALLLLRKDLGGAWGAPSLVGWTRCSWLSGQIWEQAGGCGG